MRPALFALLPVVASCGISGPNPGSELDKQRGDWVALATNSYSFVYRRSCFCPPPDNQSVRIVVFEDQVVSVTATSTGEEIDGTDLESWPTINALFDYVERAIDEGADELTVEYHAEWFYPTLISIDWLRDAVDDEISHTASGLTPVIR